MKVNVLIILTFVVSAILFATHARRYNVKDTILFNKNAIWPDEDVKCPVNKKVSDTCRSCECGRRKLNRCKYKKTKECRFERLRTVEVWPDLTEGEKCPYGKIYYDGCNTCRCDQNITYICPEDPCMAKNTGAKKNFVIQPLPENCNPGERITRDNGCTQCECSQPQIVCTNICNTHVTRYFEEDKPRIAKVPEYPNKQISWPPEDKTCEVGQYHSDGCTNCTCGERTLTDCKANRGCDPKKYFDATPDDFWPSIKSRCPYGLQFFDGCNTCVCYYENRSNFYKCTHHVCKERKPGDKGNKDNKDNKDDKDDKDNNDNNDNNDNKDNNDKVPDWEIHSPFNTGKNTYFKVYNESLRFEVKARRNAFVILSTEPIKKNPYYEVVIGGWKNTESVLRYNNTDVHIVPTPNILDGGEFRGFWVRWDSGEVSVGRQDEAKPFLFWKNLDPFTVKYCGVGTLPNVTANWIIKGTPRQDARFRRSTSIPRQGEEETRRRTSIRRQGKEKMPPRMIIYPLPDTCVPGETHMIGKCYSCECTVDYVCKNTCVLKAIPRSRGLEPRVPTILYKHN